jgi:SAM-dependent methyltransferase
VTATQATPATARAMRATVIGDDSWAAYIARYRSGQWRAPIFRDMLLAEVARLGARPTILDIGCGDGLDGEPGFQRSVADVAGCFVGIEPDPTILLGNYFTKAYRCSFEEAPLDPASVELAYSVMVLEHLRRPQVFWDKLFEVLIEGGVFWGMTVDARHPFSRFSMWADRLRIKNVYIKSVLGRDSESGNYKNYPTYYRTNTPSQIAELAKAFRSVECINFSRVGQWSPYLPRPLRKLADAYDERSLRKGRPGALLAVRVVK